MKLPRRRRVANLPWVCILRTRQGFDGARRRYDARVRRGRRLFYALTPAVLVLLIAVSPAVQRQDGTHHVVQVGTAAIRDVDASLASLTAGVAERVPVPSVWPMQAPSVDGVVLTAVSWLVVVLVGAFAFGCVGTTRRDRAPPHQLLVRV